jgi:hypothetical protein
MHLNCVVPELFEYRVVFSSFGFDLSGSLARMENTLQQIPLSHQRYPNLIGLDIGGIEIPP